MAVNVRPEVLKPASPEQKMGAKEAKMKLTDFKKLSDAQQKRFIKEAKDANKPKKKRSLW